MRVVEHRVVFETKIFHDQLQNGPVQGPPGGARASERVEPAGVVVRRSDVL